MSDIFFLVLRRLRVPLILLISVYAIATLGMTLIPGTTEDGETWYMSFFHAFYFVSFMGTTIGFGEIPHPFNDAQRAWVLVCIYTSVISWLYGIGTMLKLLQDDTFTNAVAKKAFQRSIQKIKQPFYVICGYGETGRIINKGLSELGIQTVIIDKNDERIRSIELENLLIDPIEITADISEQKNLKMAGINSEYCKGVLALTSDDHLNLQVAITSKLIQQSVKVICRSEVEDEAENMASFGTNVIINPYLTFARRLNLLTHNPALHKIHNWFINQQSTEYISDRTFTGGLPKGKWILCGYGRLGKAINALLSCDDVEIVIVDNKPIENEAPDNCIIGRGTEAHTLMEAGITDASVVIAATDDDANNLSILLTAKQLNNQIMTIGRASKEANHSLFIGAECDYIMRRSQITANHALTVISRPLVNKFIKYSSSLSNEDTISLIENINEITNGQAPVTWRLQINKIHAPAIAKHIENGGKLTIEQLCSNKSLPNIKSIPLLLERNGVSHVMPDLDHELRMSDEVLWCGKSSDKNLAQRLKNNDELLDSLINNNPHHIPLFRWWYRKNNA